MMLAIYGIALSAVAGLLVWCASARCRYILVIAVLWIPFFPLVARWLTGDVSHYLPQGTFSEGAQGKDEIVIASAYSTIMVAIVIAALLFWAIRTGWKLIKDRG